jgi:hypothetical protein
VRLEGLDKLGGKIHLIGTRSSDLTACSIVSQPTTLPRAASEVEIKVGLLDHLSVCMYVCMSVTS